MPPASPCCPSPSPVATPSPPSVPITTRTELREHYKTIKDMITEERRLREAVLANSPKLKEKLRKCDDALASLTLIANALATLLPAGEDESIVIQTELFPVPEPRRRYA